MQFAAEIYGKGFEFSRVVQQKRVHLEIMMMNPDGATANEKLTVLSEWEEHALSPLPMTVELANCECL